MTDRQRRAAKGLVLGSMACASGSLLGLILPWRFAPLTTPAYLLVGLLAMLSGHRVRQAYWVALGLLCVATTTVGLSPLAGRLIRWWVIDDGPRTADVLVVLSGATSRHHLSSASQDRLLAGLRLWRSGVARQLVFTGEPGNPYNQFHRMGPELMQEMGLSTVGVVPFEPATAGRQTTWTEAQALAAMAERHGWRSVLLVTTPAHTRRARACFRAVGLESSVTPAPSSRYDWLGPTSPSSRFRVWQELTYEASGLLWYRLKGRL